MGSVKTMKKLITSIMVFLFFFPVLVVASGAEPEPKKSITEPALTKQSLLSIYDNPGYKHLIERLKNVIKREGKFETNHFFVAKYPSDSERTYTYMVWREGRHMWILHIAGGDDWDSWQGVEYPRGGSYIDFDNGVVDTKEEVGSSTYLTDQPWVNEKVFETVINGDLIVIEGEHLKSK